MVVFENDMRSDRARDSTHCNQALFAHVMQGSFGLNIGLFWVEYRALLG